MTSYTHRQLILIRLLLRASEAASRLSLRWWSTGRSSTVLGQGGSLNPRLRTSPQTSGLLFLDLIIRSLMGETLSPQVLAIRNFVDAADSLRTGIVDLKVSTSRRSQVTPRHAHDV